MFDYKVVGNRIKSMRRQVNITQRQLAKELNLSVAYISKIERGKTPINLKRLVQFSEIMNVPISYFLTGSMENKISYMAQDFKELLDECTPEKQKCILDVAKIVAKL